MEYRRLGRTDLYVSVLGLGTMTWGCQNTEAEGHAQMDYAFDRGVTFWDTAEMYAVPPTAETYGRTEAIIGNWFRTRGRRDKVVLATKVIGRPDGAFAWIREGRHRLDRDHITRAVEDSLRRLQTDHIDLYQIHWPDRVANRFGRPFRYAPEKDDVPIAETLEALDGLVRAGKIRYVGVSNETAWGTMAWLSLAEARGWPRVAGIQNAYNLLNRTFEEALAEVAQREDCGLLAYSPLGGGTLSGKYLDGAMPPGSRRAIDPRPSRYVTPNADAATRGYLEIARRHGLEPVQMAISFVAGRPFVTSVLIGATSMDHLHANIDALGITLSDAVLKEIEELHTRFPNPCP